MYLFKRGRIYWCRVPHPSGGGKRLRISTGCTDRKAAELKARELERKSVDPTYRAAHETAFSVACDAFLSECMDRDLADGTRGMYAEKARHLVRILGERTPVVRVDAPLIGAYVDARKAEGASPHSIKKELITLHGVLSLAKHREQYLRDPRDVMPRHFSAKYVPRTGYLAHEKAWDLIGALDPHRGRVVAFIVATGARYSEAMRAHAEDIGAHDVAIRGTKTAKSRRRVPITSLSRPFVDFAAGTRKRGPLFDTWDKGAMHRDLKAACVRSGVALWVDGEGAPIPAAERRRKHWRTRHPGAHVVGSLSANDLRRTAATWLLQRGVDTYLISKVLGHVDTKMLERVYGQLDFEGVGRLIQMRLDCAPVVSPRSETGGADQRGERAKQRKNSNGAGN